MSSKQISKQIFQIRHSVHNQTANGNLISAVGSLSSPVCLCCCSRETMPQRGCTMSGLSCSRQAPNCSKRTWPSWTVWRRSCMEAWGHRGGCSHPPDWPFSRNRTEWRVDAGTGRRSGSDTSMQRDWHPSKSFSLHGPQEQTNEARSSGGVCLQKEPCSMWISFNWTLDSQHTFYLYFGAYIH